MLDLKAFDKDPEGMAQKIRRRGEVPGLSELLSLVRERKMLIQAAQVDQETRNAASKELGKASKEEIEHKRAELRELSQRIKDQEVELRALEEKLDALALTIPNILADNVPDGTTEDDNVEVARVGEPRQFDFPVRDHVEIGQLTGTIDSARAAKISGARFTFLRGAGSKLNRALIQYFADYHTSRGDTELTPPYLVHAGALTGTGQLPKFEDDLFKTNAEGAEALYLIPTAEVPVTNYLAGEILDEASLPLRFCAYSACFRAEAGAAGKDTRGLIRQHQFEKVEMVRFATPDQSKAELDAMVARAGDMLTQLGLPYRVVLKCVGDTGFQAESTYDLEVWLPGQNCYREISSCSAFGGFQARRAHIRYRPEAKSPTDKPKPEPLVTLNGSGLPLGRTVVAILENHQQADGTVRVPEVLRPYMGGLMVIPLQG